MSYFLFLYGALALWVLLDGFKRKMGAVAGLWAFGTAVLGPVTLPVYVAFRPLAHGEVREGGKPWNVLKNFAILWTVVMALVVVAAFMKMSDISSELSSEAAQAGAGLGMLIGMGILGALWFFATTGAAVLGFFLKKDSAVETGPTGPLVGSTSPRSALSSWGGLVGFALLGFVVAMAISVSRRAAGSGANNAGANTIPSISDDWTLLESRDKMDNTPFVVLRKSGTRGASITIRCSKHRTEAYLDTDTILDSGSIRVKLDGSAPARQT
jgi:hypothetical protein